MHYHPLTLGVPRISWSAKKTSFVAPKDIDEARATVFKRDDHTCRCCGFRAEKWQEVLHLNGNQKDFSDKNVLTTCIFCHQCFDLEAVAKMRSGMLIWLPEIAQADLHHLMRSLYLARVAQGGLAEAARKMFDVLYARGEEAKKRLGSTDPGALALVLRDFLTSGQYQKAQQNLEGIRLLPLDQRMIPDDKGGTFNSFGSVLAHWRSKAGPYAALPAQDWDKLFGDLAA